MSADSWTSLLDKALARRERLLEALRAEGTDAYRVFHGVAEGRPGVTVDRYGSLVLAQSFREPFSADEVRVLEEALRSRLPEPFVFAYQRRGVGHGRREGGGDELQCREAGARFWIKARHRGRDPWLFLDLRAGRRVLRELAPGASVLNLFAYTCSAGVCAGLAGAAEVWNVDFASSSLEVGRRNALLNGLGGDRFRIVEEDCLPVARQLAGLPAGGRRNARRNCPVFEARGFDVVFLDPPAWSKGPFGAVDVERDYAALFKPALLASKPGGGAVIATNHAPSVALEEWVDVLRRCAAKAGRPIRAMRTLSPDGDFPSFDGRPPLKIVVCES